MLLAACAPVTSLPSRVSQAWIRSESVVNKYSLTDQGYGLRDNNVSLVLNWNAVPSTGLLTLHHGAESFTRANHLTSPHCFTHAPLLVTRRSIVTP